MLVVGMAKETLDEIIHFISWEIYKKLLTSTCLVSLAGRRQCSQVKKTENTKVLKIHPWEEWASILRFLGFCFCFPMFTALAQSRGCDYLVLEVLTCLCVFFQVIFVISDGEINQGGSPEAAASQLKELNWEIFAIGIGTTSTTAKFKSISSRPVHKYSFSLEYERPKPTIVQQPQRLPDLVEAVKKVIPTEASKCQSIVSRQISWSWSSSITLMLHSYYIIMMSSRQCLSSQSPFSSAHVCLVLYTSIFNYSHSLITCFICTADYWEISWSQPYFIA